MTKRDRTKKYGKIFDTCREKIDNIIFEIELRMKKSGRYGSGTYIYHAVCMVDSNKCLYAEGTDINVAIKDVIKKVQKISSIKWKNCIYIEVSKGYGDEDNPNKFEMDIKINRMKIGKKLDGSNCYKEMYLSKPFDDDEKPEWKDDGDIHDGMPRVGKNYRTGYDSGGLIPYKKEYWDKLLGLIERAVDLRNKIEDFITSDSPKKILNNLKNIPKLLPMKKDK